MFQTVVLGPGPVESDLAEADGEAGAALPASNPEAITFADPRGGGSQVGIIAFGHLGREDGLDDLCGGAFLGNSWDLGIDKVRISAKCLSTALGEARSFTNADAAFQALMFWDEAAQFRLLSGPQAVQFKNQFEDEEDWTFGGYGSDWLGMFAVLRAKFIENRAYADALAQTGDAFLMEYSPKSVKDKAWFHSNFGGDVNWLGLQLMLIRDEIKGPREGQPTWTRYIEKHCGIDFSTGDPREGVNKSWLLAVQAATSAVSLKLSGSTEGPADLSPDAGLAGTAMPGQPYAAPVSNVLPADEQERPEVRRGVTIRIPVKKHVPPLSMAFRVEECATRDPANPSMRPSQGVERKAWWNTVFYMPETAEDIKPLEGCRSAHPGGVGGHGTRGALFGEHFVQGPDGTWIDTSKVKRMNDFYGEMISDQSRVQQDLERMEMERRQFMADQRGNVVSHVVRPSPYVDSHTKSPLFVYRDQLMTPQQIWHDYGLWVDPSKVEPEEPNWSLPAELPMPTWFFRTGPEHSVYRRERPMSMPAYEGSVRDDLPTDEYTKAPSFFDTGFMGLIDRIF